MNKVYSIGQNESEAPDDRPHFSAHRGQKQPTSLTIIDGVQQEDFPWTSRARFSFDGKAIILRWLTGEEVTITGGNLDELFAYCCRMKTIRITKTDPIDSINVVIPEE